MNCIEARRMVTPFINKELSDKETEQFLKHVEHCSDCMDELDIYFTVYRALDTLDSGAHHEYDFRKMMQEEIRSAKHGIWRRKVMRGLRGAVVVLAELLLLLSVLSGYEIRKGELEHSTIQWAIERLSHRNADRLADEGRDKIGPAESETLRVREVRETETLQTGEPAKADTVQEKAQAKTEKTVRE